MENKLLVPDIGDFESVEIIEILVKIGDKIKKNDSVVTLTHEMIRRSLIKGLATLCIGGGMGISMCIERD